MRKDVPDYVKEIARKLRNNQTKAEQILWNAIRRRQLGGFRFLRQYCIGRYVADFYCSEGRLAIEIDGSIHDLEEQKAYDEIREKEIIAKGIKVLRIRNEEIYCNLEGVLKRVLEKLPTSPHLAPPHLEGRK